MCLIVFAYRHHPAYRLVLAANRDEFLERPTAPLGYHYPGGRILAGKDLRGGGTWLAMGTDGRMAAITNYRNPALVVADGPSRGEIIVDYLHSGLSAARFVESFADRARRYSGFNLLLGDGDSLIHFSNVTGRKTLVSPGIHGLSNHLLDTPWPKVERAKFLLQPLLTGEQQLTSDRVFAALVDRQQPADNVLPDTGVGLEWERLLATVFIHGASYGTRSSSLLTVGTNGELAFCERSWLHENGRYRPGQENCVNLTAGD